MRLISMDEITQDHRSIYISPHLDDVVYSCGGNLALQAGEGLRPLVITVFAGIPDVKAKIYSLAFRVHRGMGFGLYFSRNSDTIVKMRRKEDVCALDYLQADYLWLDYLDAIYRGRPTYYTHLHQLVGGEVHTRDGVIEKSLTQDFVMLHERFPHANWYVPMGIGCHIDHQIVAATANNLLRCGANVIFYEDFPYVMEKDALHKRFKELNKPLEPVLVDVSQMLERRRTASELYTSQLKISFCNRAMMYKMLEDYTCNIGPEHSPMERYWYNPSLLTERSTGYGQSG